MNSKPVMECQVCANPDLVDIMSLGYMPPVNNFYPIGTVPVEQPSFPTVLKYCPVCTLVQLGTIVDKRVLFPPEYPYTSGTTRVLRDNFTDLAQEANTFLNLTDKDLVVDIGSNDGTLLKAFKATGQRVLGIEPTNTALIARQNGIPTLKEYFDPNVAIWKVKMEHGLAKVVTCTNCFAHMDNIHYLMDGVTAMLQYSGGVFITESHYLMKLMETTQYDTIYHEHLRYYSLSSLTYLFNKHGLKVFHAKEIPTHGGSIRVYASTSNFPVTDSVVPLMVDETDFILKLDAFAEATVMSKLNLLNILRGLKLIGKSIVGISAPSRATTLINYVGLDEGIIDFVYEINGSLKIGKYVPGTRIPVLNEDKLMALQPDAAVIFSWHIAEELAAKLRAKGYKGQLIKPLPVPVFI